MELGTTPRITAYAHGGLMRDPSTGVARDAAKLSIWTLGTWILNFYLCAHLDLA